GCSGGDSFRSPPNQLVCHRGCKKHVGKASKFARQQRLGRVEVRKPPQGLEQNSEVIFIPVALMLPRSQPSNSLNRPQRLPQQRLDVGGVNARESRLDEASFKVMQRSKFVRLYPVETDRGFERNKVPHFRRR